MRAVAGALALLISRLSLADGTSLYQDADDFFLDDAPPVLTATRLKQSVSTAPAAITVIDKAMIKASGAKEIYELFRLVPGMQVSYKRKHLPTVTYHGMSDEFARGLQVLVDGHSIYNASFGGVAWDDYPLLIEDIERIEVIRGPNASTFGPNSFLGIINIITTHTSQDQGAQTSFRGGSNDYYRGMGRYGGSWNDLSYRVSFLHFQNDGLEHVADDQMTNTLSTRFDYRLSEEDSLQYNFGFSDDKSQQGNSANAIVDPIRFERGSRISQNFRWTHQMEQNDQLITQFTHIRRDKIERFLSSGQPVINDTMTERLDFELQHYTSLFDDLRMVWGVGTRLDRVRMPNWLGTSDDKSNMLYRLFVNFEWPFLDDFVLNMGALLEKNSYTHVDVSPKIALNYLWSKQHSFRASASRSSRMPTIGEQNIDVSKSIDSLISFRARAIKPLKPVEVINLEVGHHGQFFHNRLNTDIKLAYQKFHRLTQIVGYEIDMQTLEPVLLYANGSEANSYNAEFQLDYKPNTQTLLHMGYSWINLNSDKAFIDYGPSAPHHSANALASYQFPFQWTASVGYYYRSPMKYLRANSGVGDFQRLDLILKKSFRVAENQNLELAVVHQNNLGSDDEFTEGNQLSDQTFFEISYQFE